MLPIRQNLGEDNCTYFTVEKDEDSGEWCAVSTRNRIIIKQSFGIGGTFDEACTERGRLINSFWSGKLN